MRRVRALWISDGQCETCEGFGALTDDPDTKEAPAGQGEGFEITHEEIEDSMTHETITCTETACINHGEQHTLLLPMHDFSHYAMDIHGEHWTVDVTMNVDDEEGPGPWQVSYTFDLQQAERLDEDELRAFMEAARTARTLELLLNATVPENALLTRGLTPKDVRELHSEAAR